MDEPHNERKQDSGWRASAKRLEDMPPPSRFELLRLRIAMFRVGPIPVGSIILLIVLFIFPLVAGLACAGSSGILATESAAHFRHRRLLGLSPPGAA